MEQAWWGIPIVVAVGALLVWYGWWSDRRRHRAALEAARRPTREIPGLPAHVEAPRYVQESDLGVPPLDPSATAAEADLLGRLDEAATLPAGAASGAFLNRADEARAVLASPTVLTLADDLAAERDVATILLGAKRRGGPLVLVAPYLSDAALAVLRANTLAGTQRVLPVPLDDAAARRKAVALSGGRLVAAADLASGWLPDEAWGRVAGWVADLDDSWVIPDRGFPENEPSSAS